MSKNPLVILQARMGSSRLPGKIMKSINSKPVIYWQIKRILESNQIHQIVVATTTERGDDVLVEYLQSEGISVFRGSEKNVLERFVGVIKEYKPRTILRITGDCPLVMPSLIDAVVETFARSNVDYLSNALDATYPDGLDVEILNSEALIDLSRLVLNAQELEHVTLGIYQRPTRFKIGKINSKDYLGNLRWTLDYPGDFEFISKIYAHFKGRELTFELKDVLDLLESNPSLRNSVSSNMRNIAITSKGVSRG